MSPNIPHNLIQPSGVNSATQCLTLQLRRKSTAISFLSTVCWREWEELVVYGEEAGGLILLVLLGN